MADGVDAVQVYAATLAEVRRQAAQLGRLESGGSEAGGSEAGSESGGWVVLESGSTPAQLPTAAGCTLWPQAQWQVAYEILVRRAPLGSPACRCMRNARQESHEAIMRVV